MLKIHCFAASWELDSINFCLLAGIGQGRGQRAASLSRCPCCRLNLARVAQLCKWLWGTLMHGTQNAGQGVRFDDTLLRYMDEARLSPQYFCVNMAPMVGETEVLLY